ncbi:tape measure protein [Bifidobacterium bifidum]|uniref:tape measure protein n=1 Tax=Bifidobacterium bifidum TaxID=1681 RepID=UPI00232E3F32|nr:tape measure protein [Bifidobacterium bifidum]MDB1262757.1 tape measure protein [Bifidobacterium bifidum]MDB1265499.1 tape measure protein [Bifidobacterium bifidum]MDB1269564.1 tape measure protein [Bifidobacterium bifidum]MDB1270546.1 tape measure protein [Bifidobacterium bifidum]MDB1275544.1 tape measure protein [Bifidobacterium bifidum]
MAYQLAQAYVQIVPSMKGVGKAIENAFDGPSKSTGQKAGQSIGSGLSVGFAAKVGAVAGIASTVFSKVASVVTGSLNSAISRADQMNNFPKVMKNLGYSSEDAAASIKKISSALDGLPTTSSAMTGMVQQLAPLTSNLDQATNIALAFNNAMLAGGASTMEQENALTQYTQMLSAGKVDMQAWRSIQAAMPGQLNQVAEAMLGAGKNSNDLYEAMKNGSISFDDFNKKVMELNQNGFGKYASFAQQAKDATQGIGTAMENVQNRVAKAVQKVVEAVGVENIAGAINGFSSQFGKVGDAAASMVTGVKNWLGQLWQALKDNGALFTFKSLWDGLRDAIMGVVNMVIDWAHMIPPDGLANGIKLVADTLNWFVQHGKELAPIIIGIGTAFAAVKGYQALNSGLQALTGTMNTVTTAAKGVSNGIMLMTDLGGPVAMLKQMAGGLSLVKTAQTAWSTATKMATAVQGAFNAVIAANPIGAIVVGVAAFVAALVWFCTQTEVGRKVWAAFTSFISSAWQKAVDFVTNLGQNIANFFTQTLPNAFQSVIQWFQQLPSAIGTALSNLITSIGTWAVSFGQSALQAGQQFVSNIANFLTNLPATIAYWLAYGITFVVLWAAQLGSQAISAGQQFLANLGTFFVQLPGNIWNWLTSTVASVASWAAQMGANALSAGSRFLSNVGTFISQLPANVGSWLSGAVSAAASFVGRMASNAVNAGSRFLSSIGSYISQVPGRIGAGLSGAISAVGSFASSMASGALRAGQQFLSNLVNTLASIPGRMVSIGSQIVHGIISGITGSIGKVGSAILGGVKDAISDVKNFLGIHSPSRLFRDQIGRNIGLGLAQGISNSQAAVMSSMNGMASDIASTRFTTPDVATGYGLSPTRASVSTGGEPLSGELLGELLSELRALHADMPLIMEKLGIEVDGRELGRVIRNAIA